MFFKHSYVYIQGSVLQDQLSFKQQDDVEDQRQLIKAQIRLGWSAEAVKQGVAQAKKGQYDSAIGCYKKVKRLLCSSSTSSNQFSNFVGFAQHLYASVHASWNSLAVNGQKLLQHKRLP